MMIPMVGYRHFIGGSGSRNRAPQTFSVLDTVARLALRGLINGDTVVQACAAVDATPGTRAQFIISCGDTSEGQAARLTLTDSVGTVDVSYGGGGAFTGADGASVLAAAINLSTGSDTPGSATVNDSAQVILTYWKVGTDAVAPVVADGPLSVDLLDPGSASASAIAAGSGPGDGTYLVTDAAAEGTEDAFTLQ